MPRCAPQVLRALPAQGYTRGLAYDTDTAPASADKSGGEASKQLERFLAAVSADGTLSVWHLIKGKEVFKSKVCPKVRSRHSSRRLRLHRRPA